MYHSFHSTSSFSLTHSLTLSFSFISRLKSLRKASYIVSVELPLATGLVDDELELLVEFPFVLPLTIFNRSRISFGGFESFDDDDEGFVAVSSIFSVLSPSSFS